MTLHLVGLPLDLNALARAAGDRGWTTGRVAAFDEGAALHHLLGETFGPAALQPFRIMVAPRAGRGTLYAYTTTDPETLRETAESAAMPEVVAALSPDAMRVRAMPREWAAGRRLGIDVRLRPVVRLAADIEPPTDRAGGRRHGFTKGAEVDAFLARALRHADRSALATAGESRENIYRAWLQERLGSRAVLEEARLAAFRRTLSRRNGRTTEQPDAVMHGTICIGEPEAFASLLAGGIGRHKAYGYGMLLIRPPGAPVPKG